jgi:hypothetical protein
MKKGWRRSSNGIRRICNYIFRVNFYRNVSGQGLWPDGIGGMEVVYKLVPYMEYASKLDAYHIQTLEKKYNSYVAELEKLNVRSHSFSYFQGMVHALETAMLHIGYQFIEGQKIEKQ